MACHLTTADFINQQADGPFLVLITNNDKEKKKPFSRILVNKLMILYIYTNHVVSENRRKYRT